MKTDMLLRNYRKNKSRLIKSIIIIVSISLIVVAQFVIRPVNIAWYTIVFTVGASLVSSLVVSTITNIFDGRDIDDEIIERFDVLRIYQENKLLGIDDQFPIQDDIKASFVNSKRLVIAMNDAKAFISNNHPLFSERFMKGKYRETVIVIQDYKQSDIIESLERKNGHETGYYKNKIKEVVNYDIKNLYDEAKRYNHKVSLYLNNNINTVAVILTDDYAMESLYRLGSGKTSVPHFVFANGGNEYNQVKTDIENLIENLNEESF